MAVWLVVLLTLLYMQIPRRAGRLFSQQRSLTHEFTTTWDIEGLTQRWQNGTSTVPWADYHDWFENREVMAFGLNEQLYHFVPTSALSPDQRLDLRALAESIETRRAGV